VGFSVTAGGTPPLRYQWRFNATNILSGATNSSVSLSNVQTNQAGNYSVIVTNGGGSIISSNALLIVTSPPPVVSETMPLYEPFPYAANTPLVGQGNWVLNGGTSGTLEAGSLDVLGLSPSSGNRLTWGNASMSLRLPLNTNLTSAEIFFSFALRVDVLGTSMTTDGTLAGFTTGTGTLFGTKVNIRTNGVGGFNLGTSKAGGTTFGDWAANNFAVGETIFVVGRYRFNQASQTDDLSDLWLNPAATSFGKSSPPPATIAGVGAGGTDLAQIDRVFFRAGGVSSSPQKEVSDELRVGFTWASVTASLIPKLTIQASGSVLLRWQTNAPGFGLEATVALSPGTWTGITNGVATIGTNYSVTVPITNASRYFRLRR